MIKERKGGAFQIARQIFNSEIWTNKPASWKVIWIYIIGNVNWINDGTHKRSEGWFRFSRNLDDIGCDITEDMVKKCLAFLRKKGMIRTSRSTRGTHLKVLNYNHFQDLKQYLSTSRSTRGALEEHDRSTPIVKELKNIRTKEYSDTIKKIVDNFYFEKLKNSKTAIVATSKVLSASYDTIDKINRIDGVPENVIREVLMRSIKDEFWSKQIISLVGLRKRMGNGQLKFMNAHSAVMSSQYRKAASQKKFLGYRYKCPACENITVEREYRTAEQYDAYKCKVEGCPKTQLVNKETIGSTLIFVEKHYEGDK